MIEPKFKVQFNPEKHEYTYDGKKFPSVTSIIPKPDLSMVNKQVLDAASKQGTMNHWKLQIINQKADQNPELIGQMGIQENPFLQWYLNELKNWINQGFKFLCIETPMIHPKKKYCGTPDMVMYKDETFFVGDLKRNIGNTKIHALQLVAYDELVQVNYPGIKPNKKKHFCFEYSDKSNFTYPVDALAKSIFMECLSKHQIEINISNYIKG